ncbi:anaerobic ribonucleoside-triphosphate reductase, partial [bacterium]|nr:anaerobic ribonucleoside-triphosphate reductase [bacterium]
ICNLVDNSVLREGEKEVDIFKMHCIVENALERFNPKVAKCYRNYRDYKIDFVKMLDKVYQESQKIMYIGDKENSNADSALVSTKRSLVLNELNKELYKKFFLTVPELQAVRDGYIYIHDMSARRDTMNCCLFDVANVLKGGFEMGNLWYNEPKSLNVAFDVIGDIVMAAASQQYGGFTVPEVDKILAPYAEKTFKTNYDKYLEMGVSPKKAEEIAIKDVEKDFHDGFQGWEYKFNTVASSRGDYPFITVTTGLGTKRFERMASLVMLDVRKGGQGKKECKKPVLFPKIVFLYDEELHGKGGELEELFYAGVECSKKSMYPDWLSLSGEGYIASMYKKYKRVISPMGCRAFLSPWYERGGMNPADKDDKPIFVGRFNIGAISLHLPMIYEKSQKEGKDFYEVLDYYMEMIRELHKRTYEYLGEMRASINPLGFCEGGFYGGHLGIHDKIKPVLKASTASFGITALNELQELYNGKSLVEDGEFALEVMRYINKKVNEFKEADGNLYAIYGTPAENLCGLQIKQFRKKYGIIDKVSDRGYVSNSFHCHVSEKIGP